MHLPSCPDHNASSSNSCKIKNKLEREISRKIMSFLNYKLTNIFCYKTITLVDMYGLKTQRKYWKAFDANFFGALFRSRRSK